MSFLVQFEREGNAIHPKYHNDFLGGFYTWNPPWLIGDNLTEPEETTQSLTCPFSLAPLGLRNRAPRSVMACARPRSQTCQLSPRARGVGVSWAVWDRGLGQTHHRPKAHFWTSPNLLGLVVSPSPDYRVWSASPGLIMAGSAIMLNQTQGYAWPNINWHKLYLFLALVYYT